jgi:hypothetical protein
MIGGICIFFLVGFLELILRFGQFSSFSLLYFTIQS